MDLFECPVCGEVYPVTWGNCWYCKLGKQQDEPSEDEWN